MSTLSTLLHHVYFFHGAAQYLLFQHCFAMSTFLTLIRYVYIFHVAALCLLRYVYSFHTATLCLLFPYYYLMLLCHVYPRCSTMSSLSTLLRHVYFFHAAALCLLFPPSCAPCLLFYFAAPCLLFPHCCVMSTFSTLLRHVYLNHVSFPMLLRFVYCYVFFFYAAVLCQLFHATVPCLPFPHSNAMTTRTVLANKT